MLQFLQSINMDIRTKLLSDHSRSLYDKATNQILAA